MNMTERNLDALLDVVQEVIIDFLPPIVMFGLEAIAEPEFTERYGIDERARASMEHMVQIDRDAHDYLHDVHGTCSVDSGDPVAHARNVMRLASSAFVLNDKRIASVAHGLEVILFDVVMGSRIALDGAPTSALHHLSDMGVLVKDFLGWVTDPVDIEKAWSDWQLEKQ